MTSEVNTILSVTPEHLRGVRDVLLRQSKWAAAAAEGVLGLVRHLLLVSLLLASAIAAYLAFVAHPGIGRWIPITCLALVLLIAGGLGAYTWMLIRVRSLPQNLMNHLSDAASGMLDAVQGLAGAQLNADEPQGFKQRIGTLMRFGKLAMRLRELIRKQAGSDAIRGLQSALLMAAPPFWIGLVVTVLAWFLVMPLAVFACILHYAFS